jgi:hypothetical protein
MNGRWIRRRHNEMTPLRLRRSQLAANLYIPSCEDGGFVGFEAFSVGDTTVRKTSDQSYIV